MKKDDWEEFHQIDKEVFPRDFISREKFYKRVLQKEFFALQSDKGQIVGALMLEYLGEYTGHIIRICVKKSMQNKGLGTKMMNFALNRFLEIQNFKKIIFFTEEDNFIAQRLYNKFGFKKEAVTWSYHVPLKSLKPTEKYKCQAINKNEIKIVGEKYCMSMPLAYIHDLLLKEKKVLTLKNPKGGIVGACRFDPSFLGCFPFEIEQVQGFDDFICGLRQYSLHDFDYVRITFTDNYKLATLLKNRGFILHHKLFKMSMQLR